MYIYHRNFKSKQELTFVLFPHVSIILLFSFDRLGCDFCGMRRERERGREGEREREREREREGERERERIQVTNVKSSLWLFKARQLSIALPFAGVSIILCVPEKGLGYFNNLTTTNQHTPHS